MTKYVWFFSEAFEYPGPSVELMKRWAGAFAAGSLGWLALLLIFAGPLAAATPYENPVPPAPRNKIDELVFARLQELNLTPPAPCSDPVFVRRVYLDVTGTLPTAAEARAVHSRPEPRQAPALIDQLLARDEFADYLALKWGDVLRIKAEFPINLWPNAAQSYHRWIREAIRDNSRATSSPANC